MVQTMRLNERTLNVLATILLVVVVGWALIWAFTGRAYDRGYNEGCTDGYTDGYDKGWLDGYDVGYSGAPAPWIQSHPQIQWHSTELNNKTEKKNLDHSTEVFLLHVGTVTVRGD